MKLLKLSTLIKPQKFTLHQCRHYSPLSKVATKKSHDSSSSERKGKGKNSNKVPNDITEYFQARNKNDLLKQFPEKYLRKKYKFPTSLYVTDSDAAELIAKYVTGGIHKDTTLVEINPGPCLLTNELIKNDELKFILFESENKFKSNLEELHAVYPDRIKVKYGDFLNLWKLHFRDKLDNGTRLNDFLSDFPKTEFQEDSNVRIIGAIGYYDFFKHLINSLAFQTSLFSIGRFEMYLIVPPPLFIHLTCTNESGYLLYRASSMLFQVMFEYKFLARLHREHFLPWQYEYNLSKSNKLTRVKSINPEFLYLIKIQPRKNLYELCPAEDMPAFWYFVKQNCVSRSNRIIPTLERWIPGCGARLIINSEKSEPVQPLYSDDNTKHLPPLSTPCTTMSNHDYFPFMNIFTQFGDLTPSQMLTLFCQFRNWPEYNDSLFLASLENSLIKMETSNEEHVDGVDIVEVDEGSIDEIVKEDDGIERKTDQKNS